MKTLFSRLAAAGLLARVLASTSAQVRENRGARNGWLPLPVMRGSGFETPTCRPSLVLFVSLALLGNLLSAPAATRTWTGSVSSDFYNPANWSPNGIPAAGDTLNIANGYISISPIFTNSGQINWTGGTLNGALFVTTSGALTLSGPAGKYLNGSITNAGTMTLASGLIFNAPNAQILNQVGALVDVQGDYTISPSASYSGMQFLNAGTFRKSAGTNTCVVTGFPFYQTGTIQALSGRVDLQTGGAVMGTCTAAAGAAITFSGGSFMLASSAVFSGPGFVGVANGAPTLSGTLATAMGWSGGEILGGWSIATNGSFTLSGSATKYLDGQITNAGTMTLSSGVVFNASNAQILNQPGARVDVQGDYTISPSAGWSGMQFLNAGALVKSAGSGSLTLQIPLLNTGQLAIQSGTLSLGTTLTLDPAGTMTGAVVVNSATINGTLHGTLTWLSGALYGQLLVANDGVLSLSGAATKYLEGTLTNAGTLSVGSALVFDRGNVQVVNQAGALVDVQGDYTISSSAGWSGLQFLNAGTFRKSAGTNTATVTGIPFLNSGTVAASSGTVDFTGGGTLAGTCTTLAGTAITFSSGSFALMPSAAFNGPGFVGMTKGSISLSGTLATAMGWNGGEILGGWSIATNGSFALSGSATKYLDGQITNAGTMTLSSGVVFDASNAQILNQPGARVDVQGDYTISRSAGWSGMQFLNAGALVKSAGSGSLTLQIPLLNTGQLAIQSGTLSLGTTLTLDPAGTMTGAVVAANSATINGTLHGSLTWLSGALYGQLLVANDAVLSLSGTATKYLEGTLTNAGTMSVGSALVFDQGNVQVANQIGALVDVQGDYTISSSAGWSGLQFLNAGTFRKSAGTNTATVTGIPFLNSGTVESQRGLLSFGPAFTNATGTLAVRLNSTVDWGRINWSGPLTLNGPFSVSLLAGYTPMLSNTFQVLTFPSVTGSFTSYNGLDLGTGLKLTPKLGPTAFSLTVEGSVSPMPPAILTQPASQTVAVGANVTFSITASGTPPLSYQWQFNHGNLGGATNATLMLTNVQLSQAGNYAVLVSNAVGFVLSSNALLTVQPISPNCVPAPAGLAAWWRGEANALDSAGTNHAILEGASFASGLVGQAFSFDGVNGAVLVPASLSTDLSRLAGWTIEAWVNPASFNNVAWPTIYAQGDWGASLGLNNGTGQLESWINNANRFVGSIALQLGHWNHVALVYDGTYRTFYVNGLSAGAGSAPGISPGATDSAIGDVAPADARARFAGQIDEVSIYSRALSSNEVMAIYTAGSAGKCLPGGGTTNLPTLWADYRFQNNLLSSVGNPPALTNLGHNAFATTSVDGIPRTVLAFGFNEGVLLQPGASVISSNVYSVVMLAALDDVSYYRRLLGFQTNATDEGWYVHNGRLSYWPVMDGASEAIADGQSVQITVTRAADGTVRGYVDGNVQLEFADADGSAGPGTGGLLRFFQDNTADASAGTVARLRIYDVALTDAQVKALDRLPPLGPTLVMARTGNNVTVAWPTNFTGYRLRSAPSLAPPIAWTTISNVSVSGAVFQATVGVTNNSRFFQLVNP